MKKIRVVSCDPGLKGAIAVFDIMISNRGELKVTLLDCFRMRRHEKHLLADLAWFVTSKRVKCDYCFIEKVHAMPGESVRSAFSFGKVDGVQSLAMAIMTQRIPKEIAPIYWMRPFVTMFGDLTGKSRAANIYSMLIGDEKDDGLVDAVMVGIGGYLRETDTVVSIRGTKTLKNAVKESDDKFIKYSDVL